MKPINQGGTSYSDYELKLWNGENVAGTSAALMGEKMQRKSIVESLATATAYTSSYVSIRGYFQIIRTHIKFLIILLCPTKLEVV